MRERRVMASRAACARPACVLRPGDKATAISERSLPSRTSAGRSAERTGVAFPCGLVIQDWYQSGIIGVVAMTLRLTDDEHEALRQRAGREGVSMQELARKAVREYVGLAEHRERVIASAERIAGAHADALRRLGQ